MITDIDIFEAATNFGYIVGKVEFDKWLESHDTEVRADAIIARDTRTPDELLQAAWEAAFPVPEGRIPSEVPYIARYEQTGGFMAFPTGKAGDMHPSHGVEYRTLSPLPPLIPDDCNAVWAGNEWLPDDVRVLWVRESDVFWRHIVTQAEAQKWCDGTLAFDVLTAVSDELINPVPVPSESEATK